MDKRDLEKEFDRLNIAILQYEERLRNLSPVCPVSVDIPLRFLSLNFEPTGTRGWTLLVRNDAREGRTSPLTNIPIHLRVEVARYIPLIEQEILKTKQTFLKDLHSVLEVLERTTAS